MSTAKRPVVPNRLARAFTSRLVLLIGMSLLALLATSRPAGAEVGVPDSNADFALLASQGFAQAVDGPHPEGSRRNIYAWSAAWFGGRLFVGVVGRGGTVSELRGQIWRYTPAGTGGIAGTWAMVFQSPLVLNTPTDVGYRWMTVCDVGGSSRLYVATLGAFRGRILYSNDGNTFQQATASGLSFTDVGYRPLVCFKDPSGRTLLVTSPVGAGGLTSQTFDSDTSNNPIVLATDNPISGSWVPYSPLRMGDPDNNSFFAMAALKRAGLPDVLYAGVANKVTGVQVWKTGGCTGFRQCTPVWTKVVTGGAGRSPWPNGVPRNVGVSDIVPHNGAMYAGVSDQAGERVPAELIRVNPDDTFEVIIGERRLNFDTTPILNFRCAAPADLDGVGGANDCRPVGGIGAGVGPADGTDRDGPNVYIWRGLSYAYPSDPAPRLYIGTFGGSGGFDMLVSKNDGAAWSFITTDGLGDPNQIGLRAIAGSPLGIFVGGVNFSDGCAVWLGTCDPALARPPVSDPRVVLKATLPAQVALLQGRTFVAYDDENYPAAGNGKVQVTLDGSRSGDPFCGDLVAYRWDEGDLTGDAGVHPGALGTTATLPPITLCTSSANAGDCPDFTPSASTPDYNEYTFTLQVQDNDGNLSSEKVIVRASRKLPPSVTVETSPPAVLSRGTWSVSLLDSDDNGTETLTVQGKCEDPEALLASCTWSASSTGVTFAGTTLPRADADPATLGTAYTATVPDRANIFLTAVDTLGNKTALAVEVRVRFPEDTAENDNPICEGTSRTIAANTVLTINPTGSSPPLCADPEGQSLAYTIVKPPTAGTGTATGGTSLVYTPPTGFTGTALFTFKGCDSGPLVECSDEVGVLVTVQAASPPPPPPPPPPSGPPPAPTGVSAALTGTRVVRVTWTDVVGETRYEVQRCQYFAAFPSLGCLFTSGTTTLAANTTAYNNTLSSAGKYGWRVRACSSVGCSAWVRSNDVQVP